MVNREMVGRVKLLCFLIGDRRDGRIVATLLARKQLAFRTEFLIENGILEPFDLLESVHRLASNPVLDVFRRIVGLVRLVWSGKIHVGLGDRS